MNTSLHQLKKTFRERNPEWANLLDKAKNQKEVEALQVKFMDEALGKLAQAYGKSPEELDYTDKTACVVLKPDQYQNLINASGDAIEQNLHVILDSLSRLKGMDNDDEYTVAAQIAAGGIGALGLAAGAAYKANIIEGALEDIAIVAGVETATVAVVCGIATIAIVAIIIPIIYYMEKPAACITLLINELDTSVNFKEQHNDHGKPQLITDPIKEAFLIGTPHQRSYGGFIVTTKRDNALIGTQYGFVYTIGDGGTDIAYGTECPLTGIYVDNNCYCAFGISAKDAADKTDSENKQEYSAENDETTLSIKCNSGSGSIAYYVARVRKNN